MRITPYQIRTMREYREQQERIDELTIQRTQAAKGAQRVAATLRMAQADIRLADSLANEVKMWFESGLIPEHILNALIAYETQRRATQAAS